jgi:hypothetical protein
MPTDLESAGQPSSPCDLRSSRSRVRVTLGAPLLRCSSEGMSPHPLMIFMMRFAAFVPGRAGWERPAAP